MGMKDEEILHSSIRQIVEKVKSRQISPVELTQLYLDRIEKLDPRINSFITVSKDEALRAASKLQETLSAGKKSRTGLLLGIPFGIKDLFATKNVRTTSGSKFLSNYIPAYNATAIERIIAEGGISLGKNNLAEFAYHTVSRNPHYGPVRNPWNPDYEAGGSSGGSSAAVAASLCVASLGSDTGGSIRIPSALCGNVGLKPTYGRISSFGVTPLSWSLDHVGIIGNRVEDVAIILEAIAGCDPQDPNSSAEAVPKFSVELDLESKIKIGIPDSFFFEEGLQSDVRKNVTSTIDLLKDLGAEVKSVKLPNMKFTRYITLIIMSSEASAYHEKYLKQHREDYGKDTLARLEFGNAIPAIWYVKAQRLRRQFLEEFQRATKDVDVIITPTTPIVAPRLDQESLEYDGVSYPVTGLLPRFTSAFNLLGLPAISVPCGLSSERLPVGMQIVGKPFSEQILVNLAYKVESNTDWFSRVPPVY